MAVDPPPAGTSRPLSALTPADARLRWVSRLRLLVAVTAVAVGFVWLQSLNQALRASSAPGCPTGTAVDMQRGPGTAPVERIPLIVTGWQVYSERIATSTVEGLDPTTTETAPCRPATPAAARPDGGGQSSSGRVNSAFDVAHEAIRVDSLVFVPAYAVALWATLRLLATTTFNASANPLLTQLRKLVVRTDDVSGTPRSRRWWVALLAAAVTFDEIENVILGHSIDQWRATLDAGRRLTVDLTWLEIFGWAKWLCLLAPLAMAVVVGIRAVVDGIAVLRQTLRWVWVQTAAAVLFVVVCNIAQGADVIRRLSTIQWLVSGVTLLAFAVVLGLTAGGLLRANGNLRAPTVPASWLAACLPGLTIAVVGGLVTGASTWTHRPGLARLGWLLMGIGAISAVLDLSAWKSRGPVVASTPTTSASTTSTSAPPSDLAVERRAKVGTCLAGLIIVGFGLATVSATAGDAAVLRAAPNSIRLRLVAGILVALAAGPAVLVLRARLIRGDRWERPAKRLAALGLASAVIVVCGSLLKFHQTALAVASTFGTLNVVAIFLASFCLLGSLASQLSQWLNNHLTAGPRVALPTAVRGLGIRTGEGALLAVAVAWAGLSSSANYSHYYAARVHEAQRTSPLLDPAAAVNTWHAQQTAPERSALLVAASGGGIRAAYWTSLVLTCLTEREGTTTDPCADPAPVERITARRRALLALSGVSGGSLGLAEYVAMVGEQWQPGAAVRPLDLDWVAQALGADYLSPTLATYLFHDALNSLVRPTSGRDRADTLEWAWERAAPPGSLMDQPFLQHQTSGEQPYLLLNGMSVGTGCRVLVSALRTQRSDAPEQCARSLPAVGHDAATSTIDLGQLCATCDLNYSTAALLSARFPFVTPAGRVDVKRPADGKVNSIDVVDGGYRENSGASTLVELYDEFSAAFDRLRSTSATCIAPIFVQIDNGYSSGQVQASGDINLNQVIAPLTAATGVATGVERAARQASIATFPQWFRISTSTHPGSSAPLGWVLSEEAQQDLRSQLSLNGTTIEAIRAAIDTPACPT